MINLFKRKQKQSTFRDTNDQGICIMYPNKLEAYGYDVHGFGSNALLTTIKYCPMCGRLLEN